MANQVSPTQGISRVLFVAVGESEVPAFEEVARLLTSEGHVTRQVTWLPRLASESTESLEILASGGRPDDVKIKHVFASQGVAVPSMAADYDRDWHFASVEAKTRHVGRVYTALTDVFDSFRPDLLVSSVGGETTRMVADVIAKATGTPTAYFNAIPLPGRFSLLKSLDAPFVPYDGVSTSFKPGHRPTDALGARAGQNGQAPQEASPVEGLHRLWAQTIGRERTYPVSWIPRKTMSVVQQAALLRMKTTSSHFQAEHVKVLYPLHDERDFQVAVRERHAIPQKALLSYVSSVLPPGFHLYVKPHPEHAASHHTSLWRDLIKRPNVHFLPGDMQASSAIAQADVIFTLASSMGFEALQAGKPVVTYGRPFYGDRGITTDVADPRTIAQSIYEAYGTRPDKDKTRVLINAMTTWSWDGMFTPLDLHPGNLEKLAVGVRDVIGQL